MLLVIYDRLNHSLTCPRFETQAKKKGKKKKEAYTLPSDHHQQIIRPTKKSVICNMRMPFQGSHHSETPSLAYQRSIET